VSGGPFTSTSSFEAAMPMRPRHFAPTALAALATTVVALSAFAPANERALTPRFNHVMLFVSNLDSSVTFYTTAFDLQVSQRLTELRVTAANGTQSARPVKMALLKFPGQEFVLELAERPAPATAGPAPYYQHLGVDVQDIAAAAERVRRAGGVNPSAIQTVSTSTGTVAKNMFFRGPSGELVELMQIVAGEF
jgi:catechol 2,3-dioxygenase-like lactoylglutathione lyase family enzyme